MKCRMKGGNYRLDDVAPVRERGLKSTYGRYRGYCKRVAPVRERGLKSTYGRYRGYCKRVAPVRERGLKYHKILYQI